jgi:small nuclear ribonucleoprotein (snRNP)-like protein
LAPSHCTHAGRGSILQLVASLFKRGFLLGAFCAAAAFSIKADEIQLKDGKTFYGAIVAYDNNMFKVKTDFGYVMVQKDKIASIIPMASEGTSAEAKSAARKQVRPETSQPQPTAESVKRDASAPAIAAPAVVSTVEKPAMRLPNAATVRPSLPTSSPKTNALAPTIQGAPPASNEVASTVAPLAPPKDAETPIVPEEVQGNVYTNHAYGFRMYKAPSWQLITEATALPNAIVAMGTSNESTLLVVGHEKTKQPLDAAATNVEKRLHEVYDEYRQISRQKTLVGGLPAVQYRYRGKADEHDWSGTLVVVARGTDIFTALGMTYAESDLIQIQENVIARAIGSLDFSVR